jgi:uncharacterized protein YjdB
MAAVGVLSACGDDVTVPAASVQSVTISISPKNSSLNIGESSMLAVQITGGSTTTPPTLASCTSSNTAVLTAAKVGTGCQITGVAAGNATVTAAASTGQQDAAAVQVSAQQAAITSFSVSPTSASIAVGQTVTITPNVVKANAANTSTVAYTSSTPAVATVNATTGVVTAVAPGVATITATATGSGTGYANSTLTQASTITVTAAPNAVTSLTVSPQSLPLAIGQTGQVTATVTTAAGVAAVTPTFSSSNTNIATVSNTGVVTAVAPGNATITVTATSAGNATTAGNTLTGTVAVTVAAPASVSLQSLTQGPTVSSYNMTVGNEGLVTAINPNAGQAVDATNVRDQIRLAVNLTTNGQRVDSVVVYVGDAAGANRRSAASQAFAQGQASNGTLFFDIRTDDFTVNTTTGAVDVKYPNGLHTLRASIWTTDAAGNKIENQQALGASTQYNFNNLDSWATIYVPPARSAQGAAPNQNLNWRGGPGAAGDGTWSIFPVFYTPGRTVQTVSTGLGVAASALPNSAVSAICSAVRTFSPGTGLMQVTFGSSAATATRVNCAGYEHPATDATNIPFITAAIDNSNNSAPIVRSNTGFRTSPSVPMPTQLRLDYAAPTTLVVNAPATQWASGVIANPYSFATNSSAIDLGVGIDAGFNRTFTYSGCAGAAVNVALTTNTAADIPECPNNVNSTQTAYTVTVTGSDRLGNARSVTSGTFGIDNVAPDIRYTVSGANATPGQGPGSALDTTTYTILANTLFAGASFLDSSAMSPTDTVFGVDVDDERSGLDASPATHFLARANQAFPTGSCVTGGASAPGVNFITNPGCSYVNAGALGGAMVDGFRPVPRILGATLIAGGQAYYSYSARVMDRAGNVTTLPVRRVLYSVDNPTITGLGVPSVITAAGPNQFVPNFTELVEGHFTNLLSSYSTLLDPTGAIDANLVFPAQLYNARFNDAIAPNGNVAIGTPFTSGVNYYTNIEQVNAAGAVVAAAPSARPDSVTARVVNAAGLSSGFYNTGGGNTGVALLAPNVGNDATTWSTFNSNILSWVLGQNISQLNAPAQGLKAVVTANTNQINSPFTRVDFYEFTSGMWLYVGSVDGTQVGCTAPAQAGCSMYIFDNGVTRSWTYRLTAPVAGLNSLATGPAFGNLGGTARRFMAIGVNGTKGRVLSTNLTAPASQVQP